jgi:hypothetical protein
VAFLAQLMLHVVGVPMTEESLARLRTHRDNIHRYRQLLETKLTDFERQFIERRLSEEQSALEALAALSL